MSGLLNSRESIRAYRWLLVRVRAAAHAAEDEEVEEVHPAEDEEHHADLDGESLDALFGGGDGVAQFQGQADVAEVDEVETDDEEVVDGVREGLVAVEDVDEKDAAVFVERASDPDGQRDAERQVNQVCGDSDGHGQPPLADFEHVQLWAEYACFAKVSRNFLNAFRKCGSRRIRR